MKKINKDCLTLKMRIIEEIDEKKTWKVDELVSYTYQLGKIVEQMQQIALHDTFRSRKQEVLFYEKEVVEALTYYWYMSEMSQIYFGLSSYEGELAVYFKKLSSSCTSFKQQHLELFKYYCIKVHGVESERVRTHLQSLQEQSTWSFFDEESLFLYPVYFRAIDLILEHLNRLEHEGNDHFPKNRLGWNSTKVELAIVVYALYEYGSKKEDKTSLQDWARSFEQLFDVAISKNYFQSLNEYKKKKNLGNSLFLRLHEIFLKKFPDNEE